MRSPKIGPILEKKNPSTVNFINSYTGIVREMKFFITPLEVFFHAES